MGHLTRLWGSDEAIGFTVFLQDVGPSEMCAEIEDRIGGCAEESLQKSLWDLETLTHEPLLKICEG